MRVEWEEFLPGRPYEPAFPVQVLRRAFFCAEEEVSNGRKAPLTCGSCGR